MVTVGDLVNDPAVTWLLFTKEEHLLNIFKGGWMICNFFEYLSPFCFLLIEFHCTFSISYNIFIFCLLLLYFGEDVIGRRDFFCSCRFAAFHTHASLLPSSSVSLFYFVLAVPMRECLGKHSCMSSPCPLDILNGAFLFSRGEISVTSGRSFVYQYQTKLTT